MNNSRLISSTAVLFSSDGENLVVGNSQGTVFVYSVSKKIPNCARERTSNIVLEADRLRNILHSISENDCKKRKS